MKWTLKIYGIPLRDLFSQIQLRDTIGGMRVNKLVRIVNPNGEGRQIQPTLEYIKYMKHFTHKYQIY